MSLTLVEARLLRWDRRLPRIHPHLRRAFIGAVGAGLVAIPISTFALRLKGGEFAIGMWVIAEVLRIVVMFDPLVQGEAGTSLLALNAVDPEPITQAGYISATSDILHKSLLRTAAGPYMGST
jgi:ABC-type branched-subunit amino acid transport system permease subunit